MHRLTILVGRLNKSIAPPQYFFKVHLVGRFVPLVGVISRRVESPLKRRSITKDGLDPCYHHPKNMCVSGGGGGYLVPTMPGCVCPKVKDMGPFMLRVSEMFETKKDVKFAVLLSMGDNLS